MQDFLYEAFNTEEEENTPAFALVPSGQYEGEIVSAMAGPTKNGKGYSVNLKWSILTEGDYHHRVIFQSVLIQHENPEAMKYGRWKFKDICDAIGVSGAVTDLTVMLNKPCRIGVTIRQDKAGQYPDKNEVGRVTPLRASHNGARDAIRTALKPIPGFKPVHADMNDSVPF
jgi:hypothetical protein